MRQGSGLFASGAVLFLLSVASCFAMPAVAHAGEDASERLAIIRRVMTDRGEWDTAETQLAAFVRDRSGTPLAAEALLLMALCQDRQKKDDAAAATYAKIIAEYPSAPEAIRSDAYLGAGDALFRLGRFSEAATQYNRLIETTPRSPKAESALLWRAESKYRQGLLPKLSKPESRDWLSGALVDYSDFLVRYPDSKQLPAAVAGAGFVAYELGDYEKALTYFNRMVKEFPADRRTEECRYYAADSMEKLNRHDQAYEAFRQVLAEYPQGAFAADARAGMAWADQNRGKFAEAAAGFEDAAKLAAGDKDAALSFLYDAGCAWREVGNIEKASAPFLEVARAEQHELNGLAWLRLGALWQEQAKSIRDKAAQAKNETERKILDEKRMETASQAAQYFRKAISTGKLDKDESEAISLLGEAYLDSGQYMEAIQAFGEVAKRWPDSDRAPWSLYHQALAWREMSAKDKSKELESLKSAAEALGKVMTYPDTKIRLQAAWALADYRTAIGDRDGAREMFRWLALESVPWARNWRDAAGKGDPALEARAKEYVGESLFRLGESYYFTADAPRAADYYQQCVQVAPNTPAAAMSLLRLGEIAESGKDLATAAKNYEDTVKQGLQLGKNRAGAAMAYGQLRLGAIQLSLGQKEQDPVKKQKLLSEALGHLTESAAEPPPGMNPSRPHYYLAETKYAMGRKKEALEDYEKSLSLDPNGEVADASWFGVAWSKRDLQDAKGAAEACRKLIDGFPNSPLRPEIWHLLIILEREAGNSVEALTDIDNFLKAYPTSPLAPKVELERGAALDESGRHAEAAAVFQDFLKAHPDHPDVPQALYQRTWALWNAAKPRIQEARDAEKKWRELSEDDSGSAKFEVDRPDVLAARNAYETAMAAARSEEDGILAALRELVERYPNYTAADAAWLRSGEILYDREDYEAAGQAYRKALGLADERKSHLADAAQYRLAWSITRLAEAAEREAMTEQAPETRDAAKKSMWEKRLAAIDAFEAIPGKYPDSALAGEACFRAAELRRRAGQDVQDEKKRATWFETAIQRYKQALDKSSDAPYVRAAQAGIGQCQLALGNPAEAKKTFQEFLRKYADGQFVQIAYWGLGQSSLDLGAYADARLAFEQALAMDKYTESAARSRYGLGLAALQSGDREQARMEFIAVDSLYPQYPRWAAAALVRAAKTAIEDGEREKARSDLERILARYPDTPSAEEARKLQIELN